MKNFPHFLIFFIVASLHFSCQFKEKKNVKTIEVNFKSDGHLKIIDTLNKPVAEFDIEIADNPFERQTGMIYREKMERQQGMLFVFEEEAERYF